MTAEFYTTLKAKFLNQRLKRSSLRAFAPYLEFPFGGIPEAEMKRTNQAIEALFGRQSADGDDDSGSRMLSDL